MREKTSSIVILTGVQGIASTIINLCQKYRRLCHPRIKAKGCYNSTGERRSKEMTQHNYQTKLFHEKSRL